MNKKVISLLLATSLSLGAMSSVMAAEGILESKPFVNGYIDDSFRPDNVITRAEVAKLITIAYDIPLEEEEFEDVSDDHWARTNIGGLEKANIITGYPDGTFRPDSPITRAEFAAITLRAISKEKEKGVEKLFRDTEGHWAKETITELSKYKVIKGYSDNTFKPDNNITRAEAVTIILRSLGRNIDEKIGEKVYNPFSDISEDSWYYNNILGASANYYYEVKDGKETISRSKYDTTSVEFINYTYFEHELSDQKKIEIKVSSQIGKADLDLLRMDGYDVEFVEIDASGNEVAIDSSGILDLENGEKDGVIKNNAVPGEYTIAVKILKDGTEILRDEGTIRIIDKGHVMYSLKLLSYPSDKKLEIIMLVRQHTGMSLKETKEFVEKELPGYIYEYETETKVMEARDAFINLGAQVETDSIDSTVILVAPGPSRMETIKVLLDFTEMGLGIVKRMVDDAPSVIESYPLHKAQLLEYRLRDIGAEVRLEIKND